METEYIKVDGKEVLVREDTAKSYRGAMWLLGTLGMIILITAILFLAGIITWAS